LVVAVHRESERQLFLSLSDMVERSEVIKDIHDKVKTECDAAVERYTNKVNHL
jgi:histidinol dehydrogenase